MRAKPIAELSDRELLELILRRVTAIERSLRSKPLTEAELMEAYREVRRHTAPEFLELYTELLEEAYSPVPLEDIENGRQDERELILPAGAKLEASEPRYIPDHSRKT